MVVAVRWPRDPSYQELECFFYLEFRNKLVVTLNS